VVARRRLPRGSAHRRGRGVASNRRPRRPECSRTRTRPRQLCRDSGGLGRRF
jgi:hypothetical protein